MSLPQTIWIGAQAQARAWGWPFAVGILAVAVAVVLGGLVTPATRRQASTIVAEIDRVTSDARRPKANSPSSLDVEKGPGRFLAAFPAMGQRQARVAAVLAMAGHHGLDIRRSEFQLGRDKTSGLVRYTMAMPLEGSYAQLRGFLEEALGADTALSLDRLRLRRASATATLVEADLAWSFYMRPIGAAASGVSR